MGIQCGQWEIYQYPPISKINKYPLNTDLFLQIAPWIPPTFLAGLGIVWCSGCPSSSLFQRTNLILPYFRYISILSIHSIYYMWSQTHISWKLRSRQFLENQIHYLFCKVKHINLILNQKPPKVPNVVTRKTISRII